jgi:hypothetical protein
MWFEAKLNDNFKYSIQNKIDDNVVYLHMGETYYVFNEINSMFLSKNETNEKYIYYLWRLLMMVIKLKEGCIVELNNIKVAKVICIVEDVYNIEISYFDEKKNPKAYISCDSEEEGNKLVDKLLEEIKGSHTVKFK